MHTASESAGISTERPTEQAKSAEVSAAKRKNREQDLEPTERDYGGGGGADGEVGAGDPGGSAARKGGGGKKRRRDAAAGERGSRGEDLDRLKKGFLGGSKGAGGGARDSVVGGAAASAEDYVQPKKKQAPKGPS